MLQVQQVLEQQFQVFLRLYCTYLGKKFINFMSLLLKMRLGSGGWAGLVPSFFSFGAESADLNEGSLRACQSEAACWGSSQKFWYTRISREHIKRLYDFKWLRFPLCSTECKFTSIWLSHEIKISLHGIYKITINFRPTSIIYILIGKHNPVGHLRPCAAVDFKTNHPPIYLQSIWDIWHVNWGVFS